MTDEHQTPQPPEESPAEMEQTDSGGVAPSNDFSSGEGMVALAGLIILAVWLLFEVFLDDYSISQVGILLAVAAVLLPRLNRDSVERVLSLGVLMKIIGYAIVLNGVIEIIADIEIGIYDSGSTVIAALISYAAYALAFMGARSIET